MPGSRPMGLMGSAADSSCCDRVQGGHRGQRAHVYLGEELTHQVWAEIGVLREGIASRGVSKANTRRWGSPLVNPRLSESSGPVQTWDMHGTCRLGHVHVLIKWEWQGERRNCICTERFYTNVKGTSLLKCHVMPRQVGLNINPAIW